MTDQFEIDVEADIRRREAAHQAPRRDRPAHPRGMRPGVRIGEDGTGEAVVAVPEGEPVPGVGDARGDPQWRALLDRFGFADAVDVLQVVEVRAWEGYSKLTDPETKVERVEVVPLHYVKARVRRRPSDDAADLESLMEEVRRRDVPAPTPGTHAERALVVELNDWQAGKPHERLGLRWGEGTRALAAAIGRIRRAIPERVAELKRIGRPVDMIVLAWCGDLLESCQGHYPMQAHMTELDRREQCRFVRHSALELNITAASCVPTVVNGVVGGNHGENRSNGKAYTTFGDNDDVAIPEQVAEICAVHPDLKDRTRWVVPEQDLTCTVDVKGRVLGLAHGHQFKRGSGIAGKVTTWWRDLALGRHPIGDADVLLTAHYHHLRIMQLGVDHDGRSERWWIQGPALDSGSRWWSEAGGMWSARGAVSFTMGTDRVVDDIKILG